MGVELYIAEVTEGTYSMTEPDADGNCMCFPPFLFKGCNPGGCLAYHIFELVTRILVLLYALYYLVPRLLREKKFNWTAQNLFEMIAAVFLVSVVIRQLYVSSLSEYTWNPVTNWFLFAFEMDSNEAQFETVAYGLGPIATWANAIIASAHMKFRPIYTQLIIGAYGFVQILAWKLFPALPSGPERNAAAKNLGVVGALLFFLASTVGLVLAISVRKRLQKFKGERQRQLGTLIGNICLRTFAMYFVGVAFHIVAAFTWFKDPYDQFTLNDYLTFRWIKQFMYLYIWIQPIFELERISSTRTKSSRNVAVNDASHVSDTNAKTETASGGSKSASVSSAAAPGDGEASTSVEVGAETAGVQV